MLLPSGSGLRAQTVRNVDFQQEGNNVVVTYDLDCPATVSVLLSQEGGRTFGPALQRVTGDVGRGVEPGRRRIVWDVLAEMPFGVSGDVAFKVKIIPGKAVDLGLSVKWATCNVGASRPEEYGSYYAWGETKSEYSESNSITFNKQIGTIAGYSRYDAARANWGGSWRLPTMAEFDELIANCTSTWTTRNGTAGQLFTSKKNGKSIFLPAAGCRNGSSLDSAGEYGDYWSASPHASDPESACYYFFYSGNCSTSRVYRVYGFSVRPVSE